MDDDNGTLMGAHGYCTQVSNINTIYKNRHWSVVFSLLPSFLPVLIHSIYIYIFKDMVNLLLTGKAISNTFDDVIELDSGGDNKVTRFFLKYISLDY